MTQLRVGLVVALLAATTACLAAPETRVATKSIASRGDRFIQLQPTPAGNRFANIASELTVLYSPGAIELRPRVQASPGAGKAAAIATLRYEFASANPSSPLGVGDSGVTYNFFVGARERWATGLKSFSQVAYRGLWPGVDATYSGDSGGIKYHFDVGVGADAAGIAFIVRGAEDARITEDGAVEWRVGGKRLRDERPVAYQASSFGDAVVPVQFTLEAAGPGAWRLGFEVGAYDPKKSLTLDPAWTAFSGLVGGNAADQVYGVARDAAGNAYACGVTASTDLPALNAFDATANGGDDAFLVKFNESGAPQFVTYFGGNGFDVCTGIAVLPSDGSISVAGGTTSDNFPFQGTGDASFRRTKPTTDRDAFVAKFGAAGNTLSYSGVIGGSDDDQAMAIALDASGRAYVTGYTAGTDFPFVTGPGAFDSCTMCAFVARIDAAGNATQYAGSFLGNGTIQVGRAIAVASDNSAYVAGETNAYFSLPSMAGTFRTNPGNGDTDGFVAKVDSSGGNVFYTVLAGTVTGAYTGADRALGVAIDADGTILVVGETDSENFPADNGGARLGTGGVQSAPSGNMDGFIVRIAGNGSAVNASSYVGGTRFDTVEGVAVDGAGGVYVTGTTANTNAAGAGVNGFPVAATSGLAITNLGLQDGFLARILSSAAPTFVGFVGGAVSDTMHAIAATPDRILSLGGATAATGGFTNTTTGALSGAPSSSNGLVLRVNPFGPPATLSFVSGSPQSANVNAAFSAPLVVKVADTDGIGLAGVDVTFTPPASGASASFSPAATVATDASGFAQVTATANAIGGGPYTVTASSAGLTSVDFALTNLKLGQTISFPAVGSQAFVASGTFGVSATATSGLTVSFTSLTPGICTAAGSTITMVTSGTCTIRASQAGNDTYAPAADVDQDITLFESATPTRPDFDADGKSDLLWQNSDGRVAVWLMNGLASVSTAEILAGGSGWTVTHMADFDGDGKTDLLWKGFFGRAAVWLMNGTAPTATAEILPAFSGWTAVATPDLNGDGKADIVWQHTDGTTAAWLMNGTAMTSGASILGPSTGWSVTKTGDFDGDGKKDLVWSHTDGRVAIWLMNGLVPSATNQILNGGSGWSAAHVADLDGDGKSDLVWENTDGSVAVWLMNGTVMASGVGIFGAGTGWSVAKTADFNGDGKADLLWQHTDGRAAIYLMNGLTPASTTQILNAGGGWSAKRTGDFNGDGKADIVWENTDGRVALWLMNGALMTSGSEILGPSSGWSVSGASP